MLFIVLVLISTRTQLFGEAESRINSTSGGIIEILASIPPAPTGVGVPTNLPSVTPPQEITVTDCSSTLVFGTPNQAYFLSGNLAHDGVTSTECIKITASGVQLDCKSYFLNGQGSGTGVYVQNGANDVKVYRCGINNFDNGVFLNKVLRAQITSNVLNNVKNGVYLDTGGTDSNTVTGNAISASQYGLYLAGGGTSDNTLSGNTISVGSYPPACQIFNCQDTGGCDASFCSDQPGSCTNNHLDGQGYTCTKTT